MRLFKQEVRSSNLLGSTIISPGQSITLGLGFVLLGEIWEAYSSDVNAPKLPLNRRRRPYATR